MPATANVLSSTQIEEFIRHGIVKVEGALDTAIAKKWVDASWARNGYDPADRSTWKEGKIHMPTVECVDASLVAPRAYAAICQLCGGEERIRTPIPWGDAFIVNYGLGADQEWIPPGPLADGWHKDGDFFVHFLDSPEQALLTIVLWDDVVPRGGATFVACDSVAPVARFLLDHPEGVNPMGRGGEYGVGFPHRQFISQCSDFREATGKAGDVYLMHPFMLHTSSRNHAGRARFITNPPVHFKEPMRFDRERAEDHCPVERAVLQALGAERQSFAPTAPRRALVPPRVAYQQKLRQEEEARKKAGIP